MRNVLITGATRGLGLILTRGFLKKNYNVIICSSKKKSCDFAKKYFSIQKNKPSIYQVDVSKEIQIKKFSKKLFNKYKNIEILINNAGIYGPVNYSHRVTSYDWLKTFSTNLNSVFFTQKYFLPKMINNNFGRIINISGGGATKPMPMYSAYSASKAALIRFTETAAIEYERYNIKINAIAPGFINTSIHQATIDAGKELLGEFFDKTQTLIHKGGDDPNNTVILALYLASKNCLFNGKLISSMYDDWKKYKNKRSVSQNIFALRRVDNYFVYEK